MDEQVRVSGSDVLRAEGVAAELRGLRFQTTPDIWVAWPELFRDGPNVIRDLGRYHPGWV